MGWNWTGKIVAVCSLFLFSGWEYYDDRAGNHGTELVIGDSIACGVADAGDLEYDCKIGLSPKGVLAMLKTYSPEKLKGRIVILSGGVSNDPSQLSVVEQELEYLDKAGAKVVILGVGQVIPDSQNINKLFGLYADHYGAIAVAGWYEVHPSNYRALLKFIRDQECREWRVCEI